MLVRLPEQCHLLLIGTPELATLGGVRAVTLEEPTRDDAAELFERASARADGVVARRTDPAVRELVDLCGRQPRAVRALARGVARGTLNVRGALETLRLAVGAPPHQRVRFLLALAAIAREDVAYQALQPESRRLFRRLGLVPQWLGPDAGPGTAGDASEVLVEEGWLAPEPLALEAMAKLVGGSSRAAAGLVDKLSRGQFVTPVQSVASAVIDEGGRYRVRPLLAAYARLHLHREEPVWRRVRAQARLVRYLARKAERHAMRPSAAGREWFACHHRLLAAVVAMGKGRPGDDAVPLPRPVRRWWFRLAEALCLWYADEGRLDEWWAACDAVRQAPTGPRPPVVGRLHNELGTLWGRPRVRGWVHNERGVILRRRGTPRAAIAELNRALPRRGRRGEAQVLTNRGLALLELGVVEPAIADFKRAVQRRSPRNKVGQGLTELGLGVAYLRSGAASDARRHLVRAADAFDRANDLRGSATARANLVLAEWETGARNAAVEVGDLALEKFAELARSTGRRDDGGQAAALLNAGAARICLDSPDPAGAYERLDEARRLPLRRLPSAEAGRTSLYLGTAASQLPDRVDEASALWHEAEAVCEEAGDAEGLAAARRQLAQGPVDGEPAT
jgi:tetratricopeptide (TPR) repeat protein